MQPGSEGDSGSEDVKSCNEVPPPMCLSTIIGIYKVSSILPGVIMFLAF